MTPPAGAAPTRAGRAGHGAPATRRGAGTRPPRRVSGPARPQRVAPPVADPSGAVAAPAPLALRVARRAARVGDARLLDRLVRGRAWIGIVAVGLLGIVFMQVSMLRLNAGISRSVARAEALQRDNAALRSDISELDAGARIQDAAGALGMLMPAAGDVNYLDARKADATSAARAIRPPDPVKPQATAATTTAAPTVTQPAATTQEAAPAVVQPAATTQAAAAMQPAATTQAAAPAVVEPAPTGQAAPALAQPTATTQAPTAAVAQPAATTQAPAAAVTQPATATQPAAATAGPTVTPTTTSTTAPTAVAGGTPAAGGQ